MTSTTSPASPPPPQPALLRHRRRRSHRRPHPRRRFLRLAPRLLLWILIGSIFIGGVHDLGALVASIRHRATSIIEVVRIHISGRAYMLFLVFVWLALVYIVVAFTDMTANMFIGAMDPVSGVSYKAAADAPAGAAGGTGTIVFNGGIATSSLIYLILPMIMGLVVRSGRDVDGTSHLDLPPARRARHLGRPVRPLQSRPAHSAVESESDLRRGGDLRRPGMGRLPAAVPRAIASVTPMWLLLQPRGQLGGYFLYAALAAGALGIVLGGQPIGCSPPGQAGRLPPRNRRPDAVHHDRLRRLLGVPLPDLLGDDIEAAPERERRQADRLRRDAPGGDGRHRVPLLRHG